MNRKSAAALALSLGMLVLLSACIYIANIRPVASFIANPTSGPTPLTVAFDASASSDADGTIALYIWDFGDGQTASLTAGTTNHTFTTIQTETRVFTVILRVVDDLDASDTTVQNITLNP